MVTPSFKHKIDKFVSRASIERYLVQFQMQLVQQEFKVFVYFRLNKLRES